MAEYSPAYDALSFGGRYRVLFKLFAHEGWRMLRRNKVPVECDTASQAIAVAKDHVDEIMRPAAIREEETVADVLGIAGYRQRKDAEINQQRLAVFGSLVPGIVRTRRGREVAVEYRRARG